MKYYIKLVTGFDDEQKYTIDAEESHKAYYLFRHPEERGVFSNGLALVGRDIRAIQPHYHATMGWNPTHDLDNDDWNEINSKGISEKIKYFMGRGSELSYLAEMQPEILGKRISEINEGELLDIPDFSIKSIK